MSKILKVTGWTIAAFLTSSCAAKEQTKLGTKTDTGSSSGGSQNTITVTPVCGNGKIEGTEACDDGDTLSNGEGKCLADCSGVQTCGNNKIEGTEVCDNTIQGPEGCLPDCSGFYCGNKTVEAWEACDDGDRVDNGEGGCLATCAGIQVCGDGTRNGLEVCDSEANCDVSCQFLASHVFFKDNFDSYADDTALEAAGWLRVETDNTIADPAGDPFEFGSEWTVTNPAGRDPPPTYNGFPTAGKFLIADSDFSDGNDPLGSGNAHDIWTPAFSTTGQATVWLHVDALIQLNNNGQDIFDIDVSTDNGANWSNVFTRIANFRSYSDSTQNITPVPPYADENTADGFYGRLHLNLSSQIADQPSVRVRFRMFEPNDDWYFILDNLVVSDNAEGQNGGTSVLLPKETFAGTFPPAGWRVKGAAYDSTTVPSELSWNGMDTSGRYSDPVDANFYRTLQRINRPASNNLPEFAGIDTEGGEDKPSWSYTSPTSGRTAVLTEVPFDDYLITPAVDCSAMQEVYLHFDSEHLWYDAEAADVLVSFDSGATFEPLSIFTYANPQAQKDSDEDIWFANRVFKVPQAAGHSSVSFAFHVKGEAADLWAIDNVSITGTPK